MNQEIICLDSDSISLCSESVTVEICSSDSSIELIEPVPRVIEVLVIEICSFDSSVELIETVSVIDSPVIDLCSSESSIEAPETVSSVIETASSEQDNSVGSLEAWLSGSNVFSDTSYVPSDSSLSSLSTYPDLSLNSYCSSSKSESVVSFASADASELFDPEVPTAAAYPAYQNLDLGTDPSDSFIVDSDSFTGNINRNQTQTNFQVLEEQREELDLEWNLFEFSFNQKYPDPKSFTVLTKWYKEASQKRLEIANKWWKLVNKYHVPQPAPPIALEL